MGKKFISVVIATALGVLVAGCGQQTPEIRTEAASPQNLVCKGIVYSNYWSEGGSWEYAHVIGPVAGATVSLVGEYETKSAVTNSVGEYVFEDVKMGSYRIEATKEGYQRGECFFVTESGSFVPDGAIFTEDVYIWANPVMRSVSPLPSSTIETDADFTVIFNKPMDTATVRPRFLPVGVRNFAAGDTVSVITAWSGNDTVLTITPNSPLLPNEVYRLYLGPNEFADVRDKDGYRLASSSIYFYGVQVEEDDNVIENNDYFTYYTSSGGAPGAPSNIMVTVNGKPFTSEAGTGVDYLDAYTDTNTVDLYCDPPSSGGPITGYRFYAAIDNSSPSDYVLLGSAATNYYTRTVAELISALYDGGSTVDPVSTQNYPFINKAVYFKAVAYNGDGESTQEASIGALKELVGPRVDSDAYSGRAGGGYTAELLNNNYYLPGLTAGVDTKIAYIAFIEPVDPATIIAGNFTHSAGTVTDATLLTSSGDNLGAFWLSFERSIVKITSDTDFAFGQTITVGSGVKDLAGNPTEAGEIATVQ